MVGNTVLQVEPLFGHGQIYAVLMLDGAVGIQCEIHQFIRVFFDLGHVPGRLGLRVITSPDIRAATMGHDADKRGAAGVTIPGKTGFQSLAEQSVVICAQALFSGEVVHGEVGQYGDRASIEGLKRDH